MIYTMRAFTTRGLGYPLPGISADRLSELRDKMARIILERAITYIRVSSDDGHCVAVWFTRFGREVPVRNWRALRSYDARPRSIEFWGCPPLYTSARIEEFPMNRLVLIKGEGSSAHSPLLPVCELASAVRVRNTWHITDYRTEDAPETQFVGSRSEVEAYLKEKFGV